MDDDATLAALHQLQLEEQEWLADEAAQVEFREWLASLDQTRTGHDHATH